MTWDGLKWSKGKNQPSKSIKAAVDYINATFSSNELVELRIGPGFYLESGTLTITCKAHVRAWDFGNNTYLNNNEDGGTKPFMGQTEAGSERGKAWNQTRAYLRDPANHPIFLSRPFMEFNYSPPQGFFQTTPLRFVFEQDAIITGCVWLGPMEVLTQAASNIPDSFFAPSNSGVNISVIRSNARLDPDNALNYFIRDEIASRSADNATWNHMYARSCIEGKGQTNIFNCAFDAMAPAEQSNNGLIRDGIITTSQNSISLSGIWIIGNVNVSSDLLSAPAYRGVTAYQYTGYHKVFVAGVGDRLEGAVAVLSLGGQREISGGTGADADYNYTWNNIHLVNNELAYRDGWIPDAPPSTSAYLDEDPTVGTNWKLIGPGLVGFLDTFNRLGQYGLFWHDQFLQSSNHHQGFAGIFGNISLQSGVQRTQGIVSIPAGFIGTEWRRTYFLRRAGTTVDAASVGTAPANPGEVGALVDFDALNAEVYPIKKGIDVVNARTVSLSLRL